MRSIKNIDNKTLFAAVLLVAYLAILLKLLIFKYPPGMVFDVTSSYYGNYMPFKTILPYLSGEPTWNVAIRNLAGNIIPFIPLGFFAPILYRALTWKHIFAIALAFSLAIEGTQVVLRTGIFDVDDILLNVLGIVLGYCAFIGVKRIVRHILNKGPIKREF